MIENVLFYFKIFSFYLIYIKLELKIDNTDYQLSLKTYCGLLVVRQKKCVTRDDNLPNKNYKMFFALGHYKNS